MEEYDFKKIGLELRRLRTEHACTQEHIADELGCTVAFISNVENNRTKVNLRVLTYYAKLFHVSVDSILNAGQTNAGYQNASAVRDAEALDILHQFSPEDQERIIKVLRCIREADSESTRKNPPQSPSRLHPH